MDLNSPPFDASDDKNHDDVTTTYPICSIETESNNGDTTTTYPVCSIETESGKDQDDDVTTTYPVCSIETDQSGKDYDVDAMTTYPVCSIETMPGEDYDDDNKDNNDDNDDTNNDNDDDNKDNDDDNDDTNNDNDDESSDDDGENDDNHDDLSDDDDDSDYSDDDESFKQSYEVYPFSHVGKTHLEPGNKIILPLTALEQLIDMNASFPMLFKLENPDNGRTTHCGVLEFSAEEGIALLPQWIMTNLSLQEQSRVNITNVTLDKATYIKLQPHSVEFLNIRNPKDALECAFCVGYSCLTVGDTILIMHEGKSFYVDIIDAKPENGVCVIDTDCEVDFAPPLDYVEPVKEDKEEKVAQFVPFSGKGRKLNEESSHQLEDGQVGELSKDMARVVFGGVSSSGSSPLVKAGGESVQEMNNNVQVFKAFTGKKYSLMD